MQVGRSGILFGVLAKYGNYTLQLFTISRLIGTISSTKAFAHYEKVEKLHATITALLIKCAYLFTILPFSSSAIFPMSYAIVGYPEPNKWLLVDGFRWVSRENHTKIVVSHENHTKMWGFLWNFTFSSWSKPVILPLTRQIELVLVLRCLLESPVQLLDSGPIGPFNYVPESYRCAYWRRQHHCTLDCARILKQWSTTYSRN